MAVVKADGYGHGAAAVARLIDSEADWFGVGGSFLRTDGLEPGSITSMREDFGSVEAEFDPVTLLRPLVEIPGKRWKSSMMAFIASGRFNLMIITRSCRSTRTACSAPSSLMSQPSALISANSLRHSG